LWKDFSPDEYDHMKRVLCTSAVARQPRTPCREAGETIPRGPTTYIALVRGVSLPLTFTLLVFALNAEPVD